MFYFDEKGRPKVMTTDDILEGIVPHYKEIMDMNKNGGRLNPHDFEKSFKEAPSSYSGGFVVKGQKDKPKSKEDCASKFHKLSKIILKHEGGFVSDPNDPGGATNKGIAWNTWKKYAKKDLGIEPTLDNLKNLSSKNAEIIYRKRYWEPKGFCKLKNDCVGLMVYDWTITSGGATRQIQKLLNNEFGQNLIVDGAMGKGTIAGINNVQNQQKLLQRISEIRKDYYTNLAIKNGKTTPLYKFLKGWKNRVDDCMKGC